MHIRKKELNRSEIEGGGWRVEGKKKRREPLEVESLSKRE